jgi:hypothetical protein
MILKGFILVIVILLTAATSLAVEIEIDERAQQKFSFHIFRAAFSAEYRFALDFIAAADNNPALDTFFNEKVPDLGLPDNIYANFNYRFLNVKIATEFAADGWISV